MEATHKLNSPAKASKFALILAFATVYLVWGSTYLGIRFAISTIPPLLMAGSRFAIAGLILLAVNRIRGKRIKPPSWRAIFILGALLLLGGNGGVTFAEQHVSSSLAALLVATEPLWLVIISAMRPAGTKPGVREICGLALGFIGVAALFFPFSGSASSAGGASNLFGAILILLAAISWAAGSIYSLSARLPEDAVSNNGLIMTAGGVLLLLGGLLHGEASQLHLTKISFASGAAFFYLVIFGSLAAFSAYTWLLDKARPSHVATYAYVNPGIAVLLGWWIGGEPIQPQTVVAMVVIIAAVVLLSLPKRTKPVDDHSEEFNEFCEERLAS